MQNHTETGGLDEHAGESLFVPGTADARSAPLVERFASEGGPTSFADTVSTAVRFALGGHVERRT